MLLSSWPSTEHCEARLLHISQISIAQRHLVCSHRTVLRTADVCADNSIFMMIANGGNPLSNDGQVAGTGPMAARCAMLPLIVKS
jgi:hypothetical protein